MADVPSQTARASYEETRILEKEFANLIQSDRYYGRGVTSLIQRIRQAYENVILSDLEFAHTNTIEDRLWTKVDYRVIVDYRDRITFHQRQHGKTRPVEWRKLVGGYINFIRTTSNWYRSLIQRLISRFNVVELESILNTFGLAIDLGPEAPPNPSQKMKQLVFESVQICLSHLGDLSRYRATQADPRQQQLRKPDLGPAKGYYSLAQALVPQAGGPFNGLAVLATTSPKSLDKTGDFLESTYNFYRALACAIPFTTAGDNLILGFRKVMEQDGAYIGNGHDQGDAWALKVQFLKMHALFYQSNRSIDIEEVTSSVLKLLEDCIFAGTVTPKLLNKLTFINLSAVHVAIHFSIHRSSGEEHQNRESNLANISFQHFGLLLRIIGNDIMQNKLKSNAASEEVDWYISPIVRRLCPSVRLYSKWLIANHSHLIISTPFWERYAQTINILRTIWQSSTVQLPRLSIPLEEDLRSAGFMPLERQSGEQRGEFTRIGSRSQDLSLRLQWGRRSGEGDSWDNRGMHTNIEITLRLADIVRDAEYLANITTTKLSIEENQFHVGILPSNENATIEDGIGHALGRINFKDDEGTGEGTVGDFEMPFSLRKMVDEIVGPREQAQRDNEHSSSSAEQADGEEIVFRGRLGRRQGDRQVTSQKISVDNPIFVEGSAQQVLPFQPLSSESRSRSPKILTAAWASDPLLSQVRSPRYQSLYSAARMTPPPPGLRIPPSHSGQNTTTSFGYETSGNQPPSFAPDSAPTGRESATNSPAPSSLGGVIGSGRRDRASPDGDVLGHQDKPLGMQLNSELLNSWNSMTGGRDVW